MKLIERYIFRRMAAALVLALLALSTMVWLSQALRQFDLVTAMGQTVWTFLRVSVLLIPVLVTVVCPIAVLIAVIYTFNSLNGDSELAVINGAGTPQRSVLKPVFLIGLIATLFVGAMSVYFAPAANRLWRSLITDVRSDIISTIVREGEFMNIADGLTFHMRDRKSDGSFEDIFLSDDRQPDETVTYTARQGAILENPLGVFLIMSGGTIQQRNKVDQSISIIEFSNYAFDLSSFAASATVPALTPTERDTSYLINPDPDDRIFQETPNRFRAELHDRLSSPLYALLFAVLPLAFLGQAESMRQSRAPSVVLAATLAILLRSVGIFLPGIAEKTPSAVVFMYGVPLLGIAGSIALVLGGIQIRPPERVVSVIETVFIWLTTFWRRGARRQAEGAA